MRIRLSIIVLFFTMWSTVSFAQQQCTIKGRIQDTLNNNYLPHAAVTLIHASDSIMETFTRTKDDGSFELHAASGDRYLVMITYPGFVDYIDIVTVKDGKTKDMGNIPMITRSHLLTEFVFEQNRGAIKVKGDTIEYVADSFKTKDNATVEELLKKLPGLQVDKNGQVTAQGEKVQKILVDGEEFFSDDPAVVTKNLQANAVDKVQVFDKKSDQAEFTGIDDGVKTKTINLELKEDKKKGYFGKAIAGGGYNDDKQGVFENQAMINSFKGKRQLSAFGIMSNTSKIGLGWEDKGKYSESGMQTVVGSDGSITNFFSNTNDDDLTSWNGTYNGEGLPTVWTAGLHYANKWDQDKEHVTGNYRFAKQNIETSGNTITQYILPGATQTSYETRNVFSSALRHNGNGMFEWKLDSLSDIKLTVNGNYTETKRRSNYNTELRGDDDSLINSQRRALNGAGNSKNETAELLWRKKFKKKGRTISVDLNENYKKSFSTDTLNSANTIYVDTLNVNQLTFNTDQQKLHDNNLLTASGKVEYTEPLSKVVYLDASYTLGINNNQNRATSINANDTDGRYTDTAWSYTSNYNYNILTNTGGLNARFVYKKFNFSFGGNVSYSAFTQTDVLHGDTSYSYNYTNFFPSAHFNYKFGPQSNLIFSYNGATNQPTISQIQPLQNNDDQFNIAVGNPGLKQELRHTFLARYNDYRFLTGRYLWLNGSVTFMQDAITRTDNVNERGQRIYTYENMNGNYFAWGYVGYGLKVPKTLLQAGAFGQFNMTHTNTKVNDTLNTSNNNTYTFGLRFNYDKNDKFDLSLTPQLSYNDNHATISTYTTNYLTGEIEFDGSVELPLKFEIGTTVDWSLRQKTEVFTKNNDVFLWNAYLSKKFLKKSQLELRLYVNDILGQNVGFNRYAQSNYIYENNYNTISRYGLISLTWNFSKSPAGAAPEGGRHMIMRK
jgi:hypothetical protein